MKSIESHVMIRPDSLELGTPSKGGALKVYFDAGDPVDSEKRIREAIRLRDMARLIDPAGVAP